MGHNHTMTASVSLLSAAAALLLLLCFAVPAVAPFSFVGKFKADHPGLVWVRNVTGDGFADLIITSFQFNPVATGAVSFVDNIGGNLDQIRAGNPVYVQETYGKLFWPNDVKVAPQGVFEGEKTLLVADGFLLAGKTPGNLVALPLDRDGVATEGYSLTGPLNNFSAYGTFHTLAKFVDFKGKGSPASDIMATKVHENAIGGAKTSHLVLRTQPRNGDTRKEWDEVVLAEGPDFAFETRRLDNTATIDAASGAVYSIQLVDLDGDGADELLVSNHQPTPDTVPAPAVMAYSIPADPASLMDPMAYKKYVLASGFACYKPGTGKAAPGWPFPFRANTQQDPSVPLQILLSGDDNGGFYVLTPNAAKGKFVYDQTTLVQYPGTVGKPEVADVDGDGWVELFLPDYEGGLIQVFTAKP